MKKSDLKAFIKEEILNEMAIQEMAKIAGDLKSSIEQVIKDNPDLEKLPLKKAIKADANVQAALGDQSLYDNQLNKFIALVKGERTVGKRGRKADPNKPSKPKSPSTGKRGRPAKSKEEKEKASKRVASKLSRSVTTDKGDEPSAKDIKQAIGSTRVDKKAQSDLQAQEKRKMVQAFIKDMKAQGIISPNGKVEDKEKYDAAWAVEREKINQAVSKINEASKEEIENQKELNKELEKTSELVSKIQMKEQDEEEPTKADMKKTKGLTKAKEELASLTKEMKSLAKQYKEAEGEEKQKLVDKLKEKTKLKKELESIVNKSL